MIIELSEIREIRKKFGLTQGELAKRANVSQSLIAKIEAGRLDPTFSNARKIFQAIDDLSKKKELKAEEIMNDKIIYVTPDDDIPQAINKMKRHEISQMPVIEENKSVGLVSESIILEAMLNKKAKKIKEIMQDSPPIVSKKTTISVLSNLLKFFPMVLVSKEGQLKGVVTRSDILRKIYK